MRKSSTKPSNASSQPTKTAVFQAASKVGCQQMKGRDSFPLLCPPEISPRVLHPALQSPTQERHGCIGTSPWEEHNDQRTRTSYCGNSRDSLVWIKVGSCEALWHPWAPKEVYMKVGAGLFASVCSSKAKGFKLKEPLSFRLDIRKVLFVIGIRLSFG